MVDSKQMFLSCILHIVWMSVIQCFMFLRLQYCGYTDKVLIFSFSPRQVYFKRWVMGVECHWCTQNHAASQKMLWLCWKVFQVKQSSRYAVTYTHFYSFMWFLLCCLQSKEETRSLFVQCPSVRVELLSFTIKHFLAEATCTSEHSSLICLWFLRTFWWIVMWFD